MSWIFFRCDAENFAQRHQTSETKDLCSVITTEFTYPKCLVSIVCTKITETTFILIA